MIIAGTGSRSLALMNEDYKSYILDSTMAEISLKSPGYVMSGMAEGFDACVALAAIRLDIPLMLAIPHKGYGQYYWGTHSVYRTNRYHIFDWFLSKAFAVHYVSKGIYSNGVHSNFLRNQYMVDNADRFVVYADSPSPNGGSVTSRGTLDCLRRIHKAHKPYTYIEFQE